MRVKRRVWNNNNNFTISNYESLLNKWVKLDKNSDLAKWLSSLKLYTAQNIWLLDGGGGTTS